MKYKKINISEINGNNNIILPEGTLYLTPENHLKIADGVTQGGSDFTIGSDTEDITFSGSTISTKNTDQNMTITTNGSGDIYIGADRNMIFDMNAFSAKGILIQDSQEDGYDNVEIPSTLKVGSIYHDTGTMVIESDGRILDASGVVVDTNGDPSDNPVYGGMWLTNGQDTGLRIPAQTGTVGGMNNPDVEIVNNEKVWYFTQDGNLSLPESGNITFGDNSTQSTAGVVSNTGSIDGATSITNMVKISQVDYDALVTKDSSTLYFIV